MKRRKEPEGNVKGFDMVMHPVIPAQRREIEKLCPVQGQSGQSSEFLASQGSIPSLCLNKIGGNKGGRKIGLIEKEYKITYKKYWGLKNSNKTGCCRAL